MIADLQREGTKFKPEAVFKASWHSAFGTNHPFEEGDGALGC
jgi:hypothetical protein